MHFTWRVWQRKGQRNKDGDFTYQHSMKLVKAERISEKENQEGAVLVAQRKKRVSGMNE